MQNVKETIQYVQDVFRQLGINYMQAEDFRQAKHSQYPQSQERMERFQKLIFDLILLISTDFKINLNEYQTQVISYDKLKTFIIQYLVQMECELLIVHQQKIGFNFNNMRDMLMLIGWLMGVSNFFEKYEDVFINQAVKQAEEIKEEVMQNGFSHVAKKRVLQQENQQEDEKLIESFNLLFSSFRKIQNLVKRKEKKLEQFKDKLSIQGVQIGIRDFILMTNPEILQQKAREMKEVSELVENMSSRIRNQEIFWEWLESAVEVDKKEYQNEGDYGFPDEIQDLTFIPGLIQIDLKQHQENIEQVQLFYSEMQESIQEFNKFWLVVQKNMNKLYSEEVIADLQENSHLVIEELDERLPSINQYIKEFDEQYNNSEGEGIVKQDLLVNFVLQHLNYNTNQKIDSKSKNNISTEEVKRMLSSIENKQQQLQKNLKDHINHIFDSISSIVTAYPNYQ
ncbi:hypothetical protein TTHERM_01100410 (macronuclear) [Tetrahymena thermophila SB210]|uniref:Uncharacterized protein n=1 Tax=Tetrahymena thermophila (strain SB210) TaxID=312017 RepID=Q22BH1_TETTS|nr:hypothetical protein TTHERM_01100410 [Tetrahymena thermophila SB210]EAR82633.2 hypothetical protein TTHERM_01100410 [Tetrahymena thermophila SB210]|eukprot:XP_001030296.2 hypothetical protein TTHERM_01100410 [Tetrahymena thermophila SB210]